MTDNGTRHDTVDPAAQRPLTMGVEEEFLLADARTRQSVHGAAAVLGAVEQTAHDGTGGHGGGEVTAEMARAQVETISAVCGDAEQLRAEIMRLRQYAAGEANRFGYLLVASGTSLLGDPGPPPTIDKARYLQIAASFGPLVDQQCVGACHVHVGVPQPEEALQVVNHLRLWTPALLALSANSPYWNGHDTGHASWRTLLWGRWPTTGPPPYLRSLRHYEQTVEALVDSGAAMDPAMLYWSVRPSRHVPTVETRIADVMPTVEDTVGYALLVRGLVAAALAETRAGRTAPPVDEMVLRAACWRAARDGLPGRALLVPPVGRPRPVPAWTAVTAMLRQARPHLEAAGDAPTVARWLRTLRERGTGAARQRTAASRRGRIEDAVDEVAIPAFRSPDVSAADLADRAEASSGEACEPQRSRGLRQSGPPLEEHGME